MTVRIDATHDPARRSFVASANAAECDFPIQNLPLAVFSVRGETARRAGIAIGAQILDLTHAANDALFSGTAAHAATAAAAGDLAPLFLLGTGAVGALRTAAAALLDETAEREVVTRCLVPMTAVDLHLPTAVTGFTDMCASTFHIGRRRGRDEHDQPICPPMFRTIPVGYDGRASSVAVSGTPVRRPNGTWQAGPDDGPTSFGPEPRLDYELELGMWIGGPTKPLGSPLTVAQAAERIVGYTLLNDWSARGIQFWETMLGPFLGKSFATSVSPWVVTAQALAPFRTAAFDRPPSDPCVPAHLDDVDDRVAGGIDLQLEARREDRQGNGTTICRTNASHLYWTPAQMIAHHVSNGCALSAGDLVGSGTCSGPDIAGAACLLEVIGDGRASSGSWLQDGETIVLRGRAIRSGFRSIGFGEVRGTIAPAYAWPAAAATRTSSEGSMPCRDT